VLLNEGQWLDIPTRRLARPAFQKWQPTGCLLKEYKADEILACAGTDRQLLFVGDSNVRQLFWAVAKKLDYEAALQATKYSEQHGDIQMRPRGVDLRFVWDPFLNGSILINELQIYQESIVRTRFEGKREIPAVMIVIGGGLWHARQFEVGAVREFKIAIDGITNLAQRRDGSAWQSKSPFHGWEGIGDQIFFIPVEDPVYERLSPSRQLTILPDEIDQMNDYLRQLVPDQGLTIPWVNQVMTSRRRFAYEASGLHVLEPVANRRADVILNLRCNAKVDNAVGSPYDRTCCSKYTSGNWFQWTLVLLGLTIVPIHAMYVNRSKVSAGHIIGDTTTIITAVASIGLALSYCFFVDRSQLFNKVQNMYNKSEFLTLCGIAFIIGALTIRKLNESLPRKSSNYISLAKAHSFLPREQIEEWKGWMQAIILIYRWTGASKELWIYITIRLVVASYLFLAGYEHAMYFYECGDYSIRRVATVLIRLNILAVALSYQMYNTYIFYNLAPLLSFWFLVAYCTFRFGAELNGNLSFLLGKIALSAALTALVHTQHQPLEFIFLVLRAVFFIKWDATEWRSWVSLDPFIAFVGMLAALLNIWYRNVQSGSKFQR
jgi:N-acetylneuraminate 9-O-acetyltransferase